MSRLTIVRDGADRPEAGPEETVISTADLKAWLRTGAVLGRLFRWREARLVTDRLETLGRPLPAALSARLLARGACYATDASGRRRPLSAWLLARWAAAMATEPLRIGRLLRAVEAEVAALEAAPRAACRPRLDLHASPLYLRADLAFGLKAGGSVGHTAGVINHLGDFAGPPIALTSDRVPTLADAIERHDIVPDEAFWNFRELPSLVMNGAVRRAAAAAVGGRRLAFVYQRYSLNGYEPVALARRHGVPLVTEYNGSEVWIARHWGRRLTHERLAARIEALNLRASDVVSVVSRHLAREVEATGVDPARVLVNPNGVDPDRYRPDIEASALRRRLGLDGATVIGFIGTFGPWHGAEVLAEAFVRLRARTDLGDVRMLWIGDGVGLPRVREIVASGGVEGACTFTGLVPQADGPAHLAACDILASPHVPNPDGTPFFGSPTKLFEYMAMGRGIVASALEQIAEVLEDGRTAALVPPGDPEALAVTLARLVENKALRDRLGAEARRVACERHTWREHVRRTVQALAEADARLIPADAAR